MLDAEVGWEYIVTFTYILRFRCIMKEIKYETIAFQGMAGAYSDLACREVYPDLQTVPCVSFDASFRAVREGKADLAMIPVDNTLAGRVADVHNLIPDGRLRS